ncbi:MAG: hypothetical protein WCA13_10655 [Terriglobales bacterium]
MIPPNFRNYQRLADISWWMGIPQTHKVPSFFPNSFSLYIAIYKEVRIFKRCCWGRWGKKVEPLVFSRWIPMLKSVPHFPTLLLGLLQNPDNVETAGYYRVGAFSGVTQEQFPNFEILFMKRSLRGCGRQDQSAGSAKCHSRWEIEVRLRWRRSNNARTSRSETDFDKPQAAALGVHRTLPRRVPKLLAR